jgi:hypothetical protein
LFWVVEYELLIQIDAVNWLLRLGFGSSKQETLTRHVLSLKVVPTSPSFKPAREKAEAPRTER